MYAPNSYNNLYNPHLQLNEVSVNSIMNSHMNSHTGWIGGTQARGVRMLPNDSIVPQYTDWNFRKSPCPQEQLVSKSHFCGLRYYGEEIDKEFLPELINDGEDKSKPNHGALGFQISHNLNMQNVYLANGPGKPNNLPVPTPRLISNEPGIVNVVSNEDGHSYSRNYVLPCNQPAYPNYEQNRQAVETALESAFHRQTVSGLGNDSSVGQNNHSMLNSFRTAAQSFQEQQGHVYENEHGWSRVVSHPTINRKVTLKDDNTPDDETKLQKRLNRFGEPNPEMLRGSLNEIIGKRNMSRQFMRINSRKRSIIDESTILSHSASTSTWLSGEGKSFSFKNDNFGADRRLITHEVDKCTNNDYNRQQPIQTRLTLEKRYRFHPKHPSGNFRENRSWDTPGRPSQTRFKRRQKKRPIVIDGSNVAFTFGEDLHFDCKGLQICVDFFRDKLGCIDVTVVVPKDRMKRGASKDMEILQQLKQDKLLIANWEGQFSGDSNSDDRLFILDIACKKGAIIVSNLSFTDISRRHPELRRGVWNRVLKYEFTKQDPRGIVFPDIDPTSTYGLSWEEVLHY